MIKINLDNWRKKYQILNFDILNKRLLLSQVYIKYITVHN